MGDLLGIWGCLVVASFVLMAGCSGSGDLALGANGGDPDGAAGGAAPPEACGGSTHQALSRELIAHFAESVRQVIVVDSKAWSVDSGVFDVALECSEFDGRDAVKQLVARCRAGAPGDQELDLQDGLSLGSKVVVSGTGGAARGEWEIADGYSDACVIKLSIPVVDQGSGVAVQFYDRTWTGGGGDLGVAVFKHTAQGWALDRVVTLVVG